LITKEKDMRRITSFLVGVIMGGLIGATLALLFAPSSGTTLRHSVVDYVQNVQDEVRQAATDKRIELEQQLADLRAPVKPSPGS
jgi:gas vesicle protein